MGRGEGERNNNDDNNNTQWYGDGEMMQMAIYFIRKVFIKFKPL